MRGNALRSLDAFLAGDAVFASAAFLAGDATLDIPSVARFCGLARFLLSAGNKRCGGSLGRLVSWLLGKLRHAEGA